MSGKVSALVAQGVSYVLSVGATIKRTVGDKLAERVSILDFVPKSEHAAIKNRTSTYDCADAIEAAQEFLSPFPWLGSVAATKAGITGATAKLEFPGGLYVIKRPVKMNPYVEFSGPFSGSFFSTGGAEIRADFDGRELFALDTAPWDSTGQRQLGKAWSSTDFDNATITGSMGQRIKKMRITCASGRNIKGGINATGAAPFFVENSTIEGFNIGIKETCSWVGYIKGSFIKARAIGIWVNGTNAMKSRDNYFGPTGVKPSSADFDWPTTPVAGYDQATRAFHMDQGYITSDSDTIESWDVAYMTTICTTFRAVNMYMEAIQLACFVLHDTQGFIQPAKINCALAKLYDVIGKGRVKEVEFILTALRSGSFSVASLGTAVTCGVSVTGAPYVTAFQTAGMLVPEFDYPNTQNIYVDSTNGVDAYAGYHPSYPVQTLMMAFARCRKGCLNVINLTAGRDYLTSPLNGNDWATFIEDVDILIQSIGAGATPNIRVPYDSGTSRMIPLAFKNCRVYFKVPILDNAPSNTTVAPGYRALINLGGLNTLRFNSAATINSQKPFLQASRFDAATLNLYFDGTTLRSNDGVTNTSLIETDTTYSGPLVWTQVGHNVTKIAVVVGSNANNVKLAATNF